jgi:hypothetical protein
MTDEIKAFIINKYFQNEVNDCWIGCGNKICSTNFSYISINSNNYLENLRPVCLNCFKYIKLNKFELHHKPLDYLESDMIYDAREKPDVTCFDSKDNLQYGLRVVLQNIHGTNKIAQIFTHDVNNIYKEIYLWHVVNKKDFTADIQRQLVINRYDNGGIKYNAGNITQSIIYANLKIVGNINLHKIFYNFMPSSQYHFIAYKSKDNIINCKYNEYDVNQFLFRKKSVNVPSKWFKNAPYSISFKVKIKEKDEEKSLVINLNETGKIECKTKWKKVPTTIDIIETCEHVRTLLKKIGEENNITMFNLPKHVEFKCVFIHYCKRCELFEKYGSDCLHSQQIMFPI